MRKVNLKNNVFLVAREVQKVYDTYYNLSKDEILSLKKEKQKQKLNVTMIT